MAQNCLMFDVRDTPVYARPTSRDAQLCQHHLLLRGHSFDLMTSYIETQSQVLDVGRTNWRRLVPTLPVYAQVLMEYYPSQKSPNRVCACKCPNPEPPRQSREEIRREFQCSRLLQTLVGCENLAATKSLLDTEDIDVNGPYKCRVILCAALQRGPMATRLVLEYGASRDLERTMPLSLQAILHYMALGDPDSCRTLDILVDFGVLRESDSQELKSTILRILGEYRVTSDKHKRAVLRLASKSRGKLFKPRSLYSLSRQVVCQEVLGPMPGRATLVRALGLGYDVRRDLLWPDYMNPAAEHFSISHGCKHKHPDGKLMRCLTTIQDPTLLANKECGESFYQRAHCPDPPRRFR